MSDFSPKAIGITDHQPLQYTLRVEILQIVIKSYKFVFVIIWIKFVKFLAEGDLHYRSLTSAVHASRGNSPNCNQIIQICFLIIWIKFVRFLAESDLHYRPLTSAVHASRGNSSNCNQILQICFLIIWIKFCQISRRRRLALQTTNLCSTRFAWKFFKL